MPDRFWITVRDGTRLAADLYLPAASALPCPAILEALPYRKDDLTSGSHAEDYIRLSGEGGFAVCRIDVRGTGSSHGRATDEYPAIELDDLADVIAWLAAQTWCTGTVGMFGYSYSGFNSLQVACERPPALGAICAIYATDDRYTDDVHYIGGSLRAIDQIDYCHYMTTCNAMPPVPALWGDGWIDEWRERILAHEPWILRWLVEQHDGDYWRHGSLRPGYERIACPTMLVGGWADGYRNNSFRTFEALRCEKALLMGPWSHQAPARSMPGPHIDLVPEMIRWFDHHLRGTDNGVNRQASIRVFMREATTPQPDAAMVNGSWRAELDWPPAGARSETFEIASPVGQGARIDTLAIRPDVGTAAWNSCAGGLPWGQPLDQREDDAWSLTYDWDPEAGIAILGHPMLSLRVASDQPVASLSAKLCDVFPDGTSALIARGFLNLTHRHSSVEPSALIPGTFEHVTVELDATTWVFAEGHRLRLSINGVDWPNTWVPPRPFTLQIDRSSVQLQLPVVDGPGVEMAPFTLPVNRADDHADDHADEDVPTVWTVERDILGRTTTARTQYGGPSTGRDGCRQRETYRGEVGVSLLEPGNSWAEATTRYELAWPEGTAMVDSHMLLRSDAEAFEIEIRLHSTLNGEPFESRSWNQRIPRHLL